LTAFEFLLALYVVLAGLGLTLVVRSVGQMIEARDHVETYWVHSAWIAFIFLIHLSSWFTFWGFRHIEVWSIGQFLLLISIPTLLYLVSHICVPEVLDDGTTYDMRNYYYARHRVMMSLLAMTMLLTLVNEYMLVGTLPFSVANVMRLVVAALVLIGACFSHPRVHAGIVIVLAIVVSYTMTLLNHTIG
jgi:hypothetical protein